MRRRSEVGLWLLVAAVLVSPASLPYAALPTAPDIAGPTSLTGQLLIAVPELRQPEFDHTVIVLVQHSAGGALGIVINRPMKEQPIADLLKAFGADASGVTGSIDIFAGGPVDPTIGFVLHSAEYHSADTLDIDSHVALTIGPDAIRDIGLGKGPQKRLVAFGYAGWAAAQLESELGQGVWMTMPEDPELVFDDDRAKVWADALARHKSGK